MKKWYFQKGKNEILRCFRSGNCVVAGTKGSGKDMLFSWVIRAREKAGERHAANIKYTEKTRVRAIKEYRLKDNGRKNFIDNEFNRESARFVEHEDYYISEAGLALPSFARTSLEKAYPTFPIVYGLSRHLGEFNIHANAQQFTRIWDKLREQADWFIQCEGCRVFFGKIVAQKFVIYNRPETALAHIQPFKVRHSFILHRSNKDDLAYAQQFNAKYGYIARFMIFHILPKGFKYDTRYFYQALYKEPAPKITNPAKRSKRALKPPKGENKGKCIVM